MQIIRKGVILEEEKRIEERLKLLPDNWFCIAGDANRFTFKTGLSTQIDFIVICPFGIFFIDAKNVSTIEKSIDDNIYFLNQKGQKIIKDSQSKRVNPVEDILNIRYQFLNWFSEKGISDFFTYSKNKRNLKIFFHALVVLSNEPSIKYKNCKLDNLPYTTHKNKTLISYSQLNEEYFKNVNLPISCKVLDQNEMAFLFKIFYYPDLSVVDLFNQFKIFENQLFAEKQIFLEKIKFLEKENNELNQRSTNIYSMNKVLLEDNQKYKKETESLNKRIIELKEYQKILLGNNINNKNIINEMEEKVKKYGNIEEEILKKESENQIILRKYKKIKIYEDKNFLKRISKKLKVYKYSFLINMFITIFIISFMMYKFNPFNSYTRIHFNDGYKTLALIEKFYFTIESFFDQKKYDKIIDIWQKEIIKNSELTTNLLKQYNLIFYYIAMAYQNQKSYENAIKYYNMFIELSKDRDALITAYYHRGNAYLELKSNFDQAIFSFKKAIHLNKELNNKQDQEKDYQLNIVFRYKLGNAYALISIGNKDLKEQYKKSLNENNFYQKAIFYYQEALDITKSEDLDNQVQIYSTIANIHFKNEEYLKAIEIYKKIIKKVNFKKKYAREIISSKNGLATSYLMLKNFKMAEKYYLNAIEQIEEKKISYRIRRIIIKLVSY